MQYRYERKMESLTKKIERKMESLTKKNERETFRSQVWDLVFKNEPDHFLLKTGLADSVQIGGVGVRPIRLGDGDFKPQNYIIRG